MNFFNNISGGWKVFLLCFLLIMVHDIFASYYNHLETMQQQLLDDECDKPILKDNNENKNNN